MDKFWVGNVEIGSVIDMVPPPRLPRDFFPDVPPEAWAPYTADVLVQGHLQLYYGHFFVRSRGRTIMVDTGMGPGPHPTRGNRLGNLPVELWRHGVQPAHVDIVVHTHLHADHVGWNLDRSGDKPRPTFPNARYLAPRVDWEHFMKPQYLANAPWVRDSVIPLQAAGLLDFFDSGHAITDEVTTLATPGHTPGHHAVLVSSQGKKAVIVGDLLHSKIQVLEPGWCAGVDTDKAASRRSREDLLKRAAAEDYVVAAGHMSPSEHVGKVVIVDGRRQWHAL